MKQKVNQCRGEAFLDDRQSKNASPLRSRGFHDRIPGMQTPRLVFMGTPEFAVPVLAALIEHYEVAAVYTRADKPAGRGKQLVESPIKAFARAHGLTIEQPRTLRHAAEHTRLRQYQPDVIVVAAYGLLVPQPILELPPRRCVNVHPSLLPRWRGASPIPFAILAGDPKTGVTLMELDAGLDTGPIITVRELPIAPDDTTGSLTEKLASVGRELLLETLPGWLEGKLGTTPQDNSRSTMSRVLAREDGLIDWSKSAIAIERMVRAFNPWPSAFTHWHDQLFKIHTTRASNAQVEAPPGAVVQVGTEVGVCTGEGVLLLDQVQLAGKRAMGIDEFTRGHRDFVGARLSSAGAAG